MRSLKNNTNGATPEYKIIINKNRKINDNTKIYTIIVQRG